MLLFSMQGNTKQDQHALTPTGFLVALREITVTSALSYKETNSQSMHP